MKYNLLGCEIEVVNNMISIQGIHKVYVHIFRSSPKVNVDSWANSDVKPLVKYLMDMENGLYSSEDDVFKVVSKGPSKGIYLCRELAHHYANALSQVLGVRILRAFDDIIDTKDSKAINRILYSDWVSTLAPHHTRAESVFKYILCNELEILSVNEFDMNILTGMSDDSPVAFTLLCDMLKCYTAAFNLCASDPEVFTLAMYKDDIRFNDLRDYFINSFAINKDE